MLLKNFDQNFYLGTCKQKKSGKSGFLEASHAPKEDRELKNHLHMPSKRITRRKKDLYRYQ